jgi:hypothetical protein
MTALNVLPRLPSLSTAPERLRTRWIVGPKTDLPWFIGGALAGYGMFFLHAGLGLDMWKVWLIWYLLLDAPHFFATYARTYLDREDFRRRRPLLLGSLAWFAVGPLMLIAGYIWQRSGLPGGEKYHGVPFQMLFAGVLLWAYWHVVRQHYGIMALYKRKNGDHARADRWIDGTFLYFGLLAPFAAFVGRHDDARSHLHLEGATGSGWTWENTLIAVTAAAVAIAGVIFLVRQLVRWRQALPINLPKVLFLLGVVPLHVVICYHPATLTAPVVAFSAFVTIFHDLQYHAIVWHYQRNRCHLPGVDSRRFGLAAFISRHFLIYAACALAVGAGGYYLGCALGVNTMACIPLLPHSDEVLFGDVTPKMLFFGVALGLFMHHYFVDQYIWRPSKDPDLQRDLNVAR